jgi:RND family efflux transporter MFP subunit
MKNLITIIILVITVVSCSESQTTKLSIDALIAEGNEVTLKKRQIELKNQLQSVNEDLEKIDEVLNSDDNNAKNPLVTTFIAKESNFMHFLELQGNVVTKQNIILYPEFAGTLTNMFVKEGQLVKRGQKLARIDDGGLSQQIAQMEVQIAFSETTYLRQKRLWEQKIGSEIQFLQTEATYKSQQNSLKQLQAQLNKTIVRAPFNGIIDDVYTEQGSVVGPGQTQLLRIVNLNNMYIEAEVPENHLLNVTKGKKVEVYFPVLGETVDTKVRNVGNYIDPSNRSFKIEVNVPNPDGQIKPNLTSKIKINDYTNPNALLIPQSIISENSQSQQYIYVVSDKDENNLAHAQRIIIQTGLTQGDFIEVLVGLDKDAEIIREGARNVKAGQKVKVINQ